MKMCSYYGQIVVVLLLIRDLLDSKWIRHYILNGVLGMIFFVIYTSHKYILGDEIFYF